MLFSQPDHLLPAPPPAQIGTHLFPAEADNLIKEIFELVFSQHFQHSKIFGGKDKLLAPQV